MKDDAKNKLKEKFGAAVSDDVLDNVAGGTFEQNKDILGILGDIDHESTVYLLKHWDQKAPNSKATLTEGISCILNQNLKGTNINFALNEKGENFYYLRDEDGNMTKRLSHAEFMAELNKRVAWEIL